VHHSVTIEQTAVYLEADEVDRRSPRLNLGDDVRFEAGYRRRHRMVRIQFVDHLRNVVDGVPYRGIGVAVIQFIADQPEQHGRMVLVLEHLFPNRSQLRGDGVGVVVVEAVTFCRHGQSERDGNTMRVRFVEQRFRVLVIVDGAPRPDRVAAVPCEACDIVPAHAGAPDHVGLAIPEKPVSGIRLHDLYSGLRGIGFGVGRTGHDEGKNDEPRQIAHVTP
jgi:hypothetical protein